MALSFPLSLADFFNTLTRVQATMTLDAAVLTAETAGGEVLPSAIGTRLWQGNLVVRGNAFQSLDDVAARVELLRQAGGSFLIRHPYRRGPANDPNGTILGGATPQITSVNVNNRDVTIGGLPAGYVLRAGDMISWTYLTSPTRYALHEVVTTATANGSGVIASVELMPPVRTGYTLPINVKLVDPLCKAVLRPGGYKPPVVDRSGFTTLSFDWRQTLR